VSLASSCIARGGNRTSRDAQTHQVLTNVLRTGTQCQLDPLAIFADLLRQATARVSAISSQRDVHRVVESVQSDQEFNGVGVSPELTS